MRTALALILLAAAYRIVAAWNPGLANFSPLMALTFCGAVYFRNRWLWLVPFAALSLSDLYLDHYYAAHFGSTWSLAGALTRTACFAAALLIGAAVSKRRHWLNLLNGTLLGAVLFYLVTNTQVWFADPFYTKTLAGWWQALTLGHPEYPPTVLFFRHTLFGDLMFTGLFAFVMERAEAPAKEEAKPAEAPVEPSA